MHILFFLFLIFQIPQLHEVSLPLFILALLIPLLSIGILVVISTRISKLLNTNNRAKANGNNKKPPYKNKKDMSKLKKDFFRKINHILIFIVLLLVWYISYSIVKEQLKGEDVNVEVRIEPALTNMLHLYLRLLTKPDSIKYILFSLEWFYYVIFFFFYILNLVFLANEMTRKSKRYIFPFFNFIISQLNIMSEREKKSYGTYLYFSVGQLFAAFICPPMVFFAILGMSSIGDLMTSQVGIKFGKKRISWNPNKTYEGSIAGMIVCFMICFIFIGPVYSLILTGGFVFCDMYTTKPLNISDNLLFPVISAILFVLIRYIFDLDYVSIILSVI
jgi:dolichol kinase